MSHTTPRFATPSASSSAHVCCHAARGFHSATTIARAALAEVQRHALADALARPGDDDDLAVDGVHARVASADMRRHHVATFGSLTYACGRRTTIARRCSVSCSSPAAGAASAARPRSACRTRGRGGRGRRPRRATTREETGRDRSTAAGGTRDRVPVRRGGRRRRCSDGRRARTSELGRVARRRHRGRHLPRPRPAARARGDGRRLRPRACASTSSARSR